MRPVPAGSARARAARASPGAASAVRQPGSHRGLRPAAYGRSFLQGHCELAEGVQQRAEAAGQAQPYDPQVAPHPGPRYRHRRCRPHRRRRRLARPGELRKAATRSRSVTSPVPAPPRPAPPPDSSPGPSLSRPAQAQHPSHHAPSPTMPRPTPSAPAPPRASPAHIRRQPRLCFKLRPRPRIVPPPCHA